MVLSRIVSYVMRYTSQLTGDVDSLPLHGPPGGGDTFRNTDIPATHTHTHVEATKG